MLFEHYTHRKIRSGDVEINVKYAGEGEAVLLVHGYPQTHAIWHQLAPELLRANHTVVMVDLRGYGDSSMPAGLSDHANYSKRAMAQDLINVMGALGFEQFHVIGHDRGARVTHRLLLDYPDKVKSAILMDIVPTYDMYRQTDMAFASGYYHWFFLIQPVGVPERLIGSDPEFYLRNCLDSWSRTPHAFDPEAVAEYIRCFSKPAAIHASCEDYRAAASIDLMHDEADRHLKIKAPLLVLWGGKGLVGKTYDVLAIWKERAEQVCGEALPCGHFLPEEAPDDTARAVIGFLAGQNQ
ncbi:MAG: alpha/beta hydrolase [Neisseria sp.]|nr:alpha/beta hydrolase [Neisseria sp.]